MSSDSNRDRASLYQRVSCPCWFQGEFSCLSLEKAHRFLLRFPSGSFPKYPEWSSNKNDFPSNDKSALEHGSNCLTRKKARDIKGKLAKVRKSRALGQFEESCFLLFSWAICPPSDEGLWGRNPVFFERAFNRMAHRVGMGCCILRRSPSSLVAELPIRIPPLLAFESMVNPEMKLRSRAASIYSSLFKTPD